MKKQKMEWAYDAMVIAGTTESRELIEELLRKKQTVLACTATELGREMLEQYEIDIHVGRLDYEGFLALMQKHPCKKIIDVSHPFARIVSETVKQAADTAGIPYELHERTANSYEYEGIIRVKNVEEAIACLNEREGNVLLTTGANTAADYMRKVKDAGHRLYIRVLDNASSLESCQKAGYPKGHVFGEMPPFSLEQNLELIQKTNARILVSKDSGKVGGVDVKVEACRAAGIPMILIERPEKGR